MKEKNTLENENESKNESKNKNFRWLVRFSLLILGLIGLVGAHFLARSLSRTINGSSSDVIREEAFLEKEASVKETSAKGTSLEGTSLEEASVKETSVKETSIKETSVKETSVKETSVKETSVKAAGGAAEEGFSEELSGLAAEAAMTEDEINEMLAGMKRDVRTAGGVSAAEAENDERRNAVSGERRNVVVTDAAKSVIDFEALWKINQDAYAWITIPGTKIDYPILQHPVDNTYYLNYNIDGSYGLPGCIYTENLNSTNFNDPNTVIYGHNMKNGSMFAGLHKFRERDFFAKHNEVIIYLPDKTLTYEIFAAYIYDDRHLLYSFDFSDRNVFSAYLKTIFSIRDMSANINNDINVTERDKIITLVTCLGNQADKRLLVQAVRR